jgi:hypothetical protein
MHVRIHKYDNLNFGNIVFGKVSKLENVLTIPLFYNDEKERRKCPLLVQLPFLLLDNDYDQKKNRLVLKLSCKTEEESGKITDFLKLLDQKALDIIKQKKKELELKKNVKLSYYSLIEDENKLKIKLPEDLSTIGVFDNDKCRVSNSQYNKVLVDSAYVKIITELHSIQVNTENPEKFEISLFIKPHQLKVDPPQLDVVLSEYSFIDESDQEEKQEELVHVEMRDVMSNISGDSEDSNNESQGHVDDSSSDEDEINEKMSQYFSNKRKQ